jgi:hypothetical protein
MYKVAPEALASAAPLFVCYGWKAGALIGRFKTPPDDANRFHVGAKRVAGEVPVAICINVHQFSGLKDAPILAQTFDHYRPTLSFSDAPTIILKYDAEYGQVLGIFNMGVAAFKKDVFHALEDDDGAGTGRNPFNLATRQWRLWRFALRKETSF